MFFSSDKVPPFGQLYHHLRQDLWPQLLHEFNIALKKIFKKKINIYEIYFLSRIYKKKYGLWLDPFKHVSRKKHHLASKRDNKIAQYNNPWIKFDCCWSQIAVWSNRSLALIDWLQQSLLVCQMLIIMIWYHTKILKFCYWYFLSYCMAYKCHTLILGLLLINL